MSFPAPPLCEEQLTNVVFSFFLWRRTDGGMVWIQGQHQGKPACPCGETYYTGESSRRGLKTGTALRDHVARCPRVPNSGVKNLCR